ncbi:MAG: phenylalanine--tRNA ligase subunit beta [Flavobacteriales bacterium]|nr:phenylalanine--tRNA ligase subunit beta [Flavobacteriales bacterium]MBL6873467.1 phenylalanine--tRNA ligase subunit beta [Flavobacteriales bacterium]
MKISYNWLKEYINIDLDANVVAKYLTDTGLEVEGIEIVESIKGGLKGIVIGEVLTKEQHPNADRLSVTTVDIGKENNLQIVCGAPNVEAGQKVPVATIGTIIYSGDDSFKIKKGKIRGEVSEGMICAEDEIGLGNSHEGIMVLDANAKSGQLASEYFNIKSDIVFEIGLTPNRSDAMSHIGVARDLAAVLHHNNIDCQLKFPDISSFKEGNEKGFSIEVKDYEACPRYVGLTIENITVGNSPDWIKKNLTSIGLTPINNVVDITNYVLHETGQPLHAFDASKIKNQKVIVQQLNENTKFTTLDEQERKLSSKDLIICNGDNEPMCLAGVFGGIDSGVSNSTTSIFLESAYFNPVSVRKTAKRHSLSTDASFRFERSVDPNLVIYALKRAANLLVEICGATISSTISDLYPEKINPTSLTLNYDKVDSLIGEKIDRSQIISILNDLDIDVETKNNDQVELSIPPYRIDVTREEDVIEEILRIYGYNNISIPKQIKSSISYSKKPNSHDLQNTISDLLSSNGFNECMNNSLSKSSYSKLIEEIDDEKQIVLLNPLSQELDGMRQSMLFSGLENISYNLNRKASDLSFYEFGNTYHLENGKYVENRKLILLATGNASFENWYSPSKQKDFFWMKKRVEHILKRLGVTNFKSKTSELSFLDDAYTYTIKKDVIAKFGSVSDSLLSKFGIKNEVLYAEIEWGLLTSRLKHNNTTYKEINKFPSVRRDLALLLDKDIEFSTLNTIAKQTENKLLKSVNLFDVYEGDKLPKGKKSYALSFALESPEKTLTDKEIDKVMSNLIQSFEQKVGAVVRK